MSISTASPRSGRAATSWFASRAGRATVGVEAGEARWKLAQLRGRPDTGTWRTASFHLDEEPDRARGWREGLRAAGIGAGHAVCALGQPAVDIFPLALDANSPPALEREIVTRAQEHLGYPLAEAVLDYALLPRAVRRSAAAGASALVFAVARSRIEPLLARLAAAGLAVDRIVTPACAVAACLPAQPGARRLAICSADEVASVAIIQEGAVLLERLLPWGLQRLAERLAGELSLPLAQARDLLSGGPAMPPAATAESDLDSAVEQILGPALRDIAQEASACLGYCDSFLQPLNASGAVLLGPLAHLHPLRLLIEQELGLGIENASALAVARGGPDPAFDLAACCALWPAASAGGNGGDVREEER